MQLTGINVTNLNPDSSKQYGSLVSKLSATFGSVKRAFALTA
ncbi:hypothetical protein ACPOL_5909 [Acidisarcina polymorpha]|uniref:Uncharacterized protein n=1 Tax=Acidisarcina polymorpha TaxID=2211140 RepID=A0A2Z5G7B1_9BACT|nr:hypothetical protein ACPOL_5909 [Acidisarcina polymorpha]